jgi:hypothetical protein
MSVIFSLNVWQRVIIAAINAVAMHGVGAVREPPLVPPVRRTRLHAEAHRGTAVPCPYVRHPPGAPRVRP